MRVHDGAVHSFKIKTLACELWMAPPFIRNKSSKYVSTFIAHDNQRWSTIKYLSAQGRKALSHEFDLRREDTDILSREEHHEACMVKKSQGVWSYPVIKLVREAVLPLSGNDS